MNLRLCDSVHVVRNPNAMRRCLIAVMLLASGIAPAIAEQPAVRSLAFSTDGKWLAVASSNGLTDGGLFVRDVASHQMIFEQRNPEVGMTSVDFAADGTLAVGQFAPTALLYDVKKKKRIANLQGHENHVRTVKFTSDGKRLITGSYDRTVKIWDVDSGKLVGSLDGHPEAIFSVALNSDDSRLAVAVARHPYEVWLWELNHRKVPLVKYRAFGSLVPSVAFSPDSQSIAAASWDGNLSIFDWQDQERKNAINFRPGGGVDSVAFSHDQRRLAVGSGGLLYVQDLNFDADDAAKAQIGRLFRLLDHDDYEKRVSAMQEILDFGIQAQSELRAGLGSESAEVRWRCRKIRDQLMAMSSARKLEGHRGGRFQIAFSSDDLLMATGDDLGEVRIWDTQTWKAIEAFQIR